MVSGTSRLSAMICVLTAWIVGISVARAGGPPADPDYKIFDPGNTGIPGYANMMLVDGCRLARMALQPSRSARRPAMDMTFTSGPN